MLYLAPPEPSDPDRLATTDCRSRLAFQHLELDRFPFYPARLCLQKRVYQWPISSDLFQAGSLYRSDLTVA